MKKTTIRFAGISALALAGAVLVALPEGVLAQQSPTAEGQAASEQHNSAEGALHFPLRHPAMLDWSFSGVLGKYDPAQLQRGFQVYKEVCSACHSMKLVAIRTLADKEGPRFSPEQVASLAATYQIHDGPNDKGEMFDRPGKPSDHFPSPFPNSEAAKAANNGAEPPDLSLIAKARGISRGFPYFLFEALPFAVYQEAGPDYVHALLTGYSDAPAGTTVPPNTYYNPFFAGGISLSMPPPLQDGQVTYSDGSPQTVDQYARDVASFLMWAAEPHLTDRKRIGFQALIFLVIFGVLMYLTKRRVWAHLHGHSPAAAE